MKWFPFQVIMLHTADNMNRPDYILHSLLKVFSMFDISICYYKSIVHEQVPYAVAIVYVNCGKNNWLFIILSTDRIFHQCFCWKCGVLAYWFILDRRIKKELKLDFQQHCTTWILNGPWYNTTIFHNCMIRIFKIMLPLQ